MAVVAANTSGKMIKLAFILLGSFWLSCGNSPRTGQDQAPESKEKTESFPGELTENVTSYQVQEEGVLIREKEKSEVEGTVVVEQKEELSGPETIVQETVAADKKLIMLPDHAQWNTLLSKYVNDEGDVDYKGFQSDLASLENYLNLLAENSPKKVWTKNEKLAYYINLYNAATVKLILDNYPTRSIKDIKNPWGKNWVKTGDGKLSLGDIEHKILRKMDEPRIHFAINCASFSCPKLLNEAFTAAKMESQLQRTTLDFVNDPNRNSISKKKMQLSNIFKWYKKDFTENGSLIDYIKPYTEIDINDDTDIDYLKYDWNLNEAK